MQRRKTISTKESGLKSSPNSGQSSAVPSATVVRHLCGTSPFDKYWVNWDCCGLFCAAMTYGLHIYGCYSVTQVLLPPWMSTTVDGVRSVSIIAVHMVYVDHCSIRHSTSTEHFDLVPAYCLQDWNFSLFLLLLTTFIQTLTY